jgi:hypothetical protein
MDEEYSPAEIMMSQINLGSIMLLDTRHSSTAKNGSDLIHSVYGIPFYPVQLLLIPLQKDFLQRAHFFNYTLNAVSTMSIVE